MTPLVSIIVPVYNTERTLLEKCVQSLLTQTYKNLEIIIIDDGSNECTANLCNEIGLLDVRIKVVHKQNGGLSSARNAGLDIAKGDFISFVDSDDFIEDDSIRKLLNVAKDLNVEIACMRSIVFNEHGEVLYQQGKNTLSFNKIVWSDYIKGICYKQLSESVCDKLFSRRIIDKNRFEQGRLNEDFIFLSKLLMSRNNIGLLDYCGYHYLKHSGTITADKANFKSLKNAIQNSCELADISQKYANEVYLYYVYSALFQTKVLLSNLRNINSDDWRYCIEVLRKYKPYINCCNLSKIDQLLIWGFWKLPYLTKILYSMIK